MPCGILKIVKWTLNIIKEEKMILQKAVGNIYSVFVEILMWALPIAASVVAGILLSDDCNDFHFGWALLGLLGGFILDIILFGPIIIFLNMRASLKNIENR